MKKLYYYKYNKSQKIKKLQNLKKYNEPYTIKEKIIDFVVHNKLLKC